MQATVESDPEIEVQDMKKESLILDTSLFVNPAAAHVFGQNPTTAFVRFLEMAGRVDKVEFVMPPRVYGELMHFARESEIPKKLLITIQKKPPKRHETKVPGIFIYELVESMRDRVDRGLRLAERHIREALQMAPLPPPRDFKGPRPDAEAISRLRESYRRIMREGMLDSRADADLLLLAYEIDGTLVSADLGVVEWADRMGVKTLSHDHFYDYLLKNSRRARA